VHHFAFDLKLFISLAVGGMFPPASYPAHVAGLLTKMLVTLLFNQQGLRFMLFLDQS